MIVQYLLTLPNTPIAFYGLMPDDDALPHSFPALYSQTQEPRDAEEYMEICDKLKAWRVVHVSNYTLLE